MLTQTKTGKSWIYRRETYDFTIARASDNTKTSNGFTEQEAEELAPQVANDAMLSGYRGQRYKLVSVAGRGFYVVIRNNKHVELPDLKGRRPGKTLDTRLIRGFREKFLIKD